jgi:uncharacterized membrane protein
MSLNDPEEDYEDLIQAPTRRSKAKGKIKQLLGKLKFGIIILIIGIICGILLGHLFIEPLLQEEESNVCKTCVVSKELLNKEITCLYELIDEPNQTLAQCKNIDN